MAIVQETRAGRQPVIEETSYGAQKVKVNTEVEPFVEAQEPEENELGSKIEPKITEEVKEVAPEPKPEKKPRGRKPRKEAKNG